MTPEQMAEAGAALFTGLPNADLITRLRGVGDLASIVEYMTFDVVREAREDLGYSWETIGTALGISKQTAWERWHHHVEEPTKPSGVASRRSAQQGEGTAWWKMNVSSDHIPTCERSLRFGTSKALALQPGDVLLLQANVSSTHDPAGRITRALIFESMKQDRGESLRLWNKPWTHLITASECRETTPFSLENLPLKGTYRRQGMMSPQRILAEDVPVVRAASGLVDL